MDNFRHLQGLPAPLHEQTNIIIIYPHQVSSLYKEIKVSDKNKNLHERDIVKAAVSLGEQKTLGTCCINKETNQGLYQARRV